MSVSRLELAWVTDSEKLASGSQVPIEFFGFAGDNRCVATGIFISAKPLGITFTLKKPSHDCRTRDHHDLGSSNG